MLPRSYLGEDLHRKLKREMEISYSLTKIHDCLTTRNKVDKSKLCILEFGSGNGYQIPYIEKLGNTIATDIYIDRKISKINNIKFIKCSITKAPFQDNVFDLIYSNHVIEHIQNLQEAFTELNRIGKVDCIYAFIVPTNLWLVLTIPAQYFTPIRLLSRKILQRLSKNGKELIEGVKSNGSRGSSIYIKILKKLFPKGHGVYKNFFYCYNSFKIKAWRKIFSDSGFREIETFPLLIYGPSEWPIIPIMKPYKNICSSVLFLMEKSATV